MRQRKSSGFSLIEILVVLVVLVVGILSAMRLFPLGIIGLTNTRDYTTAQVMARREIDKLATHADDLPLQILPVRYVFVGSNLVLQTDPMTPPRELGAAGDILENGNMIVPGGGQVPWRYGNDANRVRRIIGEGGTIPAPRPVGQEFGGLKILSFAPIVDDPTLLLVYGSDMEEEGVRNSQVGQVRRNPRQWEFEHDDGMAQVWLPGTEWRPVSYRLSFGYYINNGGQIERIDVIDEIVTVSTQPVGGDPTRAFYDVTNETVTPINLLALIGNPPGFVEIAWGSITASRLFDQVPLANAFDPRYPYEYKVLAGNLGAILFNPRAYNYRERRGRERVALTAQVNYDVYDWHIISEEIRGDRTRSPLHKLALHQVKATGEMQNDKRRYDGLNVPIPDGQGGTVLDRDVIVMDLDTGGIVSKFSNPGNLNGPVSYKIDYLRGVIAFGSPALAGTGVGELSNTGITIILPDANQTLLTDVDPAGRNFRVLYKAQDDWAVQVFKAPQRITVSRTAALGVAQAYVGGTPNGSGGNATRIYFAPANLGAKVSIREIWYRDGANNLQVIRDHDFLIRGTSGVGDPLAVFASVDIREVDPNAVGFDWTNGYAVRGIGGSSVRARVIWNKAEKEDVPGDSAGSIADRMDLHEAWTRQWRKVEVESYLTRRDRN
ncbi:MAG: prepilin-type N-terminal cleavage/methylation domain-containing protein [Armatimonadota bacterium]|nr:prepilin-type N-terminal cleavage/methylation domain-containing protein [Armatimonadota bacterium]